ncbi:MAG TPA: HPF/RaiA family ribosome-associated protein [Longimicrobiales bacterium]|nr:HPF/RaiA family ribosome-associated protein [Longimicrobiales bacterium]
MEIRINARHGKMPESLRNQAEQRFSRLERLDSRITAGALVVDGSTRMHRAEARLLTAGGPPLIAHGEGPTLRGAIDSALHRVERQLKRRGERRLARRSRPAPAIPVQEEEEQ